MAIFEYGLTHFGERIAVAYSHLIETAINDLADDPKRIGTRPVGHHPHGIFAYPLEFSKKRAGARIRKPAHSVFFFTVEDEILVIASLSRPSRENYIQALDIPTMRDEIEGD